MGKKIYLICPVRKIRDKWYNSLKRAICKSIGFRLENENSGYTKEVLDRYVRRLESLGYEVHYPIRDVNQDDPTGMRIMTEHRRAMYWCDEVRAVWKPASTGSVGDLGMYWGMAHIFPKPFRLANKRRIEDWLEKNPGKSHTRWAYELYKMYRGEKYGHNRI
jgi:hypothetical protein